MSEFMRKPKVGDTLWYVYHSRYAGSKSSPCKVTKVGRKYFTIDIGAYKQRFHNDTWCENTPYSSDVSLYENKQEWSDSVELTARHNLMIDRLRNQHSSQFTLEQYRNAMEALGIPFNLDEWLASR